MSAIGRDLPGLIIGPSADWLRRHRCSVAFGEHWTLYRGDARKVLPTIEWADHVITDPPYSRHVHQSVRSSGRRELPDVAEFACRSRRTVDLGFEHLGGSLRRFVAAWCSANVRRWSLAFSDVESAWLWRLSFEASGLDYARTLAWVRAGGAPQFSGDRPASGFEAITAAHVRGRKAWNGGGKRGVYYSAVVNNRGGKSPRLHTTQKPLPLMVGLVSDFTDPGEVIVDPFAGSATTGIACLHTGRRFVGIERDRACFDVAVRRLRAAEAAGLLPGSAKPAKRGTQAALFFALGTELTGPGHTGPNAPPSPERPTGLRARRARKGKDHATP